MSFEQGFGVGAQSLQGGVQTGLAASKMKEQARQEQMILFQEQYTKNLDSTIQGLAQAKQKLDADTILKLKKLEKTVLPEKLESAKAGAELEYKNNLEKLKQTGLDAYQKSFMPLTVLGAKQGYFQPNQADVDKQKFMAIFDTIRPDQAAILSAIKTGEEQAATFQENPKDEVAANAKRLLDAGAIDQKQYTDILAKRTEKLNTVVGRTEFDVSANKKKDLDIAADKMAQGYASVLQTSKAIKEVPGAVGLAGQITEKAGGAASQIPLIGKPLQEVISQTFSGASPEQVAKARSKYKALLGQMVRAVTQDTGRLSDQDRNYAKEVMGNIDSILENPATLSESILNLTEIQLSTTRDAMRQASRPVSDLNTKEGLNSVISSLRDGGFNDDDITRIIIGIKQREAIKGKL